MRSTPGAFEVGRPLSQTAIRVIASHNQLRLARHLDMVVINATEIDLLNVDVAAWTDGVGLGLLILKQSGVASAALQIGAMPVRTGDVISYGDEGVAGGAPIAGRIVFLLQPVIGCEDEVESVAELVNFRRPEAVLAGAVVWQVTALNEPGDGRPMHQVTRRKQSNCRRGAVVRQAEPGFFAICKGPHRESKVVGIAFASYAGIAHLAAFRTVCLVREIDWVAVSHDLSVPTKHRSRAS